MKERWSWTGKNAQDAEPARRPARMVRSIWRITSRYGIHCPVHFAENAQMFVRRPQEKSSDMSIQSKMFYEQSGGGVTFSGGEVMSVDMDFVLAAAKELDRQGISLTIDTCGYAPYERFQKILPYVDTFLYDVKIMDPELHKKYIGVDNKLILENLVRLSQDGARIYIRIPTIKEVNGNEQNMKETIAFLQEHDIHPAQINLLPYHDTGSGKYRKLDMEYKGTDLHAPDKEEMEALAAIFINAGYTNTKIGG